MHARTLMLFLALAALPLAAAASRPIFSESASTGSTPLSKVGEGAFRWMFFKVYDGVLYLDPAADPAWPLADVAKRLELAYAVRISASQFRESGDNILRRNVDEAEWQALQERLARLNAAYRDVQPGDRYALAYAPGEGTTLLLNGEPLVTIEGADFARAYFSIWLGEDPAKASFRRALLGG